MNVGASGQAGKPFNAGRKPLYNFRNLPMELKLGMSARRLLSETEISEMDTKLAIIKDVFSKGNLPPVTSKEYKEFIVKTAKMLFGNSGLLIAKKEPKRTFYDVIVSHNIKNEPTIELFSTFANCLAANDMRANRAVEARDILLVGAFNKNPYAFLMGDTVDVVKDISSKEISVDQNFLDEAVLLDRPKEGEWIFSPIIGLGGQSVAVCPAFTDKAHNADGMVVLTGANDFMHPVVDLISLWSFSAEIAANLKAK